MQHGAPRTAILLANDLRSGARLAADRDRARAAAAGVELGISAPEAPRRSLLDVVRQHVTHVPAASAGAR